MFIKCYFVNVKMLGGLELLIYYMLLNLFIIIINYGIQNSQNQAATSNPRSLMFYQYLAKINGPSWHKTLGNVIKTIMGDR